MGIYTKMSSDLDRQIELLRRCQIISEQEVKVLCDKAREILIEESNVQRVDAPVTVRIIKEEEEEEERRRKKKKRKGGGGKKREILFIKEFIEIELNEKKIYNKNNKKS